MSLLSREVKKFNRARNKVTRQVMKEAGGRLIGGAGMRTIGLAPRNVVTPAEVPAHLAPYSGDIRHGAGPHRCASAGRKPFVMKSVIAISSGAQAINTDLADFFASGAIDQVGTSGTITGDVSIREASMTLVLRDPAITVPGENLSTFVGGLYLILSVNGIEAARYGVEDFDPVIQITGGTTSGAASTTIKTNAPIPFPIDFDPDTTYKLALRVTKAVTLTAAVSGSMSFKGSRVAG